MQPKIRVLIAKIGLDGHDRGAKVISRFLRDAGMEVIYTGIRRTPEEIGNIALQEDVDLVGVSILSGSQKALIPRLFEVFAKRRITAPLVVGGIIPDEDRAFLESIGVRAVFTPGTSSEHIVKTIGEIVAQSRNSRAGSKA